MLKRDLKVAVKEICEYALLEGRNADWKVVTRSFSIAWEEYFTSNPNSIERDIDISIFVGDMETLFASYERGQCFGEDENTIVFKLKHIAEIYMNAEKWRVI